MAQAQARSGPIGWIVAGVLGLVVIVQAISNKPAGPASGPGTRYVNARALNCRDAPLATAVVVRSLARNEPVTIAEERGGWTRLAGSPACWAASQYLAQDVALSETTEPVAAAPPPQANGLMTNITPTRRSQRPAPRSYEREELEEAYVASAAAYYPNCAAARAAGVAPLLAGSPGYRPGLDRDGDGRGCE